MLVIGVTGGLGTGKSAVARMFGELGATVIDADQVAHAVMEPKRLAWRALVRTFGRDILNEDETINRTRLAERVFRDAQARQELEAIVHPPVIRHIKQQLSRLSRLRRGRNRDRIVVLDVPLLMETGSESLVERVVVVTAPPEIQRKRLAGRGMSEAQISERIAAQWEMGRKVAMADHVVDNADGLEQTRRQVRELWKQLLGVTRRPRA